MRRILIILPFLLSACLTQKKCAELFPPSGTISDTTKVTVRTVTHDSIIVIPGASISFRDTLPCPELDYHREVNTTVDSGSLSATVDIHDGRINVTCKEDSLRLRIQLLEKITDSLQKHIEVRNIPVPGPTVTVTKIPGWMWWYLIISIVILYFLIKPKVSTFIGWAIDLFKVL